MRWLQFTLTCIFFFIEIESTLISLINQLNLKNPIIIGNQSAIQNKEMFQMMKSIMKLNQTITISTNVVNLNFQSTSGILIKPDENILNKLYSQKINKPWIIIKRKLKKYCRIDEPIYILDRDTLYEHYELKSLKVSNIVARKYGKVFKWNKNMHKNLYERRGNFRNITLIGVVDAYIQYNKLPIDLDEKANKSNILPNSYEVRGFGDIQYDV